jgi:hypothetical protein
MVGQTEGSRESGKATALRQQTGSVTIGPYQDNMRLTRRVMARIILSLIGQHYTVARMARIMTDSGTVQEIMFNPEDQAKVQAMTEIVLKPDEIGKYDVVISETPTTPTLRTAQFIEIMEMRNTVPPIPIPDEVVVKASDVPYKEEILAYIAQMRAQAQQAMAAGMQPGATGAA